MRSFLRDPLHILSLAGAGLVILILVIILWTIVAGGWSSLSWTFVSKSPEEGMTAGGIFPAIFGTVALVLLMVVCVFPVGVAAAIYLCEYANPLSWWVRLSKGAISSLSGVPSIVFGLFGLAFFIQFMGRGMDHFLGLEMIFGKPSLLWAAMTLAILNLPVVIVTTEESLRQVAQDQRMASYALGATRWQTISRVVLPQSLAGILTGAILAISRGAGEVAPILFTGAAYFLPTLPKSPTDQFMELGYHTYIMATQSPDVDKTLPLLYGTVTVLMSLVLLLNLTAVVIRRRFRRTLQGAN